MDFFRAQKIHNPKHNKKKLTQDQIRLLESSFVPDKKLEPELKLRLSNQLGVPPRQVAIWYQNKRARWRTQSLELDYSTLQVKLETALGDKRKLERDVKMLQEEVRRCQEMLSIEMKKRENDCGNCFNVGVGVGYCCCSSFGDDFNSCEGVSDGQVVEIDELYACMIGTNNVSSS